MSKLGLWDGDTLIWRFGWIDDEKTCIRNTSEFIRECHEKAGVNEGKFFVGDTERSNFRYKICPNYKAQRKGCKRPPNEQAVREYLISQRNAKVVTGAEVDDALGICQDDNSVIFTNDKDLDMIPGWHFDLDFHRAVNYKGGKQIRKAYKKRQMYKVEDPGFLALRKSGNNNILIGAGQLWFCAQMLLGDSADNIFGISKLSNTRFGPVAAYNLLKDCKTFEEALKICYNKYIELDIDDVDKQFEINSRLLWIKRKVGKEEIYPLQWVK